MPERFGKVTEQARKKSVRKSEKSQSPAINATGRRDKTRATCLRGRNFAESDFSSEKAGKKSEKVKNKSENTPEKVRNT